MKSALLIVLFFFVMISHAEIKVSTDNLKISNDCLSVESDNVRVKSGDCDSRGKGKGKHENRSVHGDNNPGAGHDKHKNSGKYKD